MAIIKAKHTKYLSETDADMKYVHAHPHYEIYYLTKGDRHYFIEDNVYRVVSGDFALISPGKMHKTSGPRTEFIHIFFDEDAVNDNIRHIIEKCFDTCVISIPPAQRDKIQQLLFDMCSETSHQSETSSKMLSLLFETLIIYLYRFSSFKVSATKNEDETYNKILDAVTYINKNYALDVSVNQLCQMSYLSQSYFCKKFKSIIGMPAAQYINCIRVNEAAKLLQNTSLSITEIASATGFTSSNYFGDIFKKYRGTSPQQFRKNLKQ